MLAEFMQYVNTTKQLWPLEGRNPTALMPPTTVVRVQVLMLALHTPTHPHTHTLSLLPDFSGIRVSERRSRSPGISYQVKKGQCSEFRVLCFTNNKMHNARSHSIAHVSWFKK
jgi:hypothetical protein